MSKVTNFARAFTVGLLMVPLTIPSASAQTELDSRGCPVSDAVVISTAGDNNSVGRISQSFTIPSGFTSIGGRVRFLSDEFPEFVGTEFNDTFLARISAGGRTSVLASGNVNSSSFSSGAEGFNGQTPEITYNFDGEGLDGEVATLTFEVMDVADQVVDSGLAIDAVRVFRTELFLPLTSTSVTTQSAVTLTQQAGQVVRITVRNINVLGVGVSISDNSAFGRTDEFILLPFMSRTLTYSLFAEEPVTRSFTLGTTVSDAGIYTADLESTWVPGQPENPCF